MDVSGNDIIFSENNTQEQFCGQIEQLVTVVLTLNRFLTACYMFHGLGMDIGLNLFNR